MPNRSSGSRCSRAARPCAIGTGRSSRLRHFRKERTRRRREGCSRIDGGSVRPSRFLSLTSCDVFEELAHALYVSFFFFCWQVTPESSHKRRWITSARACRPSSTILTRCFCGATSFPCNSLTMPRIPTCERFVTTPSLFSNPSPHCLIKESVALSYRRNGAICRYFRSQGPAKTPAHRCWHVRGAW